MPLRSKVKVGTEFAETLESLSPSNILLFPPKPHTRPFSPLSLPLPAEYHRFLQDFLGFLLQPAANLALGLAIQKHKTPKKVSLFSESSFSLLTRSPASFHPTPNEFRDSFCAPSPSFQPCLFPVRAIYYISCTRPDPVPITRNLSSSNPALSQSRYLSLCFSNVLCFSDRVPIFVLPCNHQLAIAFCVSLVNTTNDIGVSHRQNS